MYMPYILLLHYYMIATWNQHRESASPYREPTASVNCGLHIKCKKEKVSCVEPNEHP